MHAAAAVGGAALHDSTPAQVALMAAFACLYVGTHRALLREHARHDPALRT
jgi:hypothetical protein